jgi:alkanesulfonate monooxygenase SsuD/methylene tetrahydromethanopterin reductase-like flavin-dependent oxidoreductase (luciferase family)
LLASIEVYFGKHKGPRILIENTAKTNTALQVKARATSQTKLFRYDEDMASRAAEVDMVTGDLERATERLQSLERELEIERERMIQMQQSPDPAVAVEQSIDAIQAASLEREVVGSLVSLLLLLLFFPFLCVVTGGRRGWM